MFQVHILIEFFAVRLPDFLEIIFFRHTVSWVEFDPTGVRGLNRAILLISIYWLKYILDFGVGSSFIEIRAGRQGYKKIYNKLWILPDDRETKKNYLFMFLLS